MVLADLPETSAVGKHGTAFVQHHSRSSRERAVRDVAMAGNPTDISGTPIHIVRTEIEYPLRRHFRAEEIPTRGVLNAFRLAGRAGCIQKEQGMFRLDPLGLTLRGRPSHNVVPPHVAIRIHGHGLVGPPIHDDALHGRTAAGQGLVGGGLELDDVTGAPAAVGGNHELRAGVLDPVLERER